MDTALLIATLTDRLPDHEISMPGADGSDVSFRSPHPAIGNLAIVDDGDEFTVYIGDITHRHFELDDELDNSELAAKQAVDTVVDFVEAILTDQIEFYGGGTYGGSRSRSDKPRGWLSRMFLGSQTYLWSGPITDDS